VMNVIKAMLSETDTLDGDDRHILSRIEGFLKGEGSQMGAAKQLLILVDRAVRPRFLSLSISISTSYSIL
jgi:hypothetical protein